MQITDKTFLIANIMVIITAMATAFLYSPVPRPQSLVPLFYKKSKKHDFFQPNDLTKNGGANYTSLG
jgi:hypothetical protein